MSPTFAGEKKSVLLPDETTFKAMPSSTLPSPGAESKSFSVVPASMSIRDAELKLKQSTIPRKMADGSPLVSLSGRGVAQTWREPETLSDSEAEFENSYMRASATRPFGWSYGSMLYEACRLADSV